MRPVHHTARALVRIVTLAIAAVALAAGPLRADEARRSPDPGPSPVLKVYSLADLLDLRVEVDGELRRRDVIRTGNNLTANLSEHIFVQTFDWTLETASQEGFDVMTEQGERVQIKGRRARPSDTVWQLSAIRNLDGFDLLAAVILDERWRIRLAAIIPASVIRERAVFTAYTNSYRVLVGPEMFTWPGVRDVTEATRRATGLTP